MTWKRQDRRLCKTFCLINVIKKDKFMNKILVCLYLFREFSKDKTMLLKRMCESPSKGSELMLSD